MSDRLKDLQRQRALAQEQLDWLDREIARETGAAAAFPTRSTTPALPEPAIQPVSSAVAPSPEQILAQYQTRGRPMAVEAKRGCILYFIVGMILLVLAVGAVFLVKYKRG